MLYIIYLRNAEIVKIATAEYAYEVWGKTKELAELLGINARMTHGVELVEYHSCI